MKYVALSLAFSSALGLVACADDPACDSGWTRNGFTTCDDGCGDSTRALTASGPACTALTNDNTTVQCAKTFMNGGEQACCSTAKPEVHYAVCQ
ncbi:MAG TPA: hypothetical protein VGM90_06615 [Kofleriaceae bacterium]|jgi:hypothetical protein